MLSLDEPLDLKIPCGRGNGRGNRQDQEQPPSTPPTLAVYPLHAKHTQKLRMADDGTAVIMPASPASPHTCVPMASQEKSEARSPPSAELRLSPYSCHFPQEQCSGNGAGSLILGDSARTRYLQRGVASQAFQLFLPVGSGSGFHVQSSVFIGQPMEKRESPDHSKDEELICRWRKCHLFFDSLQKLVDHVNDFHVKPEKDSGYCCHWEGCARKGRGFNARYKMLIHIRTHTNEKPHCCTTCNKSFSRLENLKIHNRSHTGEKPYTCPYEGCNKRYSNSSDRFKHTRTHYVDKPYYCKMVGCLKRYTDPSSLRKHIKAHGHFATPDPLPLSSGVQKRGSVEITGVVEKDVEFTYTSRAHIIIPGPGALLGGHVLQGLSSALPLPPISPRPLDLSAVGCSGSPSSGLSSSPVLPLTGSPLGLAKSCLLSPTFSSPALGLPMVSLLGQDQRSPSQHGKSKTRNEGGKGHNFSEDVLNLSTGTGHDSLLPSWLVIPSGSVVLKPAVVN